jgi:hypothetical protein
MENSTDSKINQARDGITQIGRDLRSDAHAGIDKIAEQVPPATERLAAQAHTGVDKVADGVGKPSERRPRAASNWRPAAKPDRIEPQSRPCQPGDFGAGGCRRRLRHLQTAGFTQQQVSSK